MDAPLTTPVSFDLGPGERVALVGPSGSGKSTVAALLLRFLDPERGRVTIGGARLRTLSLDDVRRRVGLVDDDPHLFATTLVENIRLARPDASDAEAGTAQRVVHLGVGRVGACEPDVLDESGGEEVRVVIDETDTTAYVVQ